MKTIIALNLFFIFGWNIALSNSSDPDLLKIFKQLNLNPEEAQQKYLLLLDGEWPKQGEAIDYFKNHQATALLALALPNLRAQARKEALDILISSPEPDAGIIKALIRALEPLAVNLRRDGDRFSDGLRWGMRYNRPRIVGALSRMTGVSSVDIDLDNPDELKAFMAKIEQTVQRGKQ